MTASGTVLACPACDGHSIRSLLCLPDVVVHPNVPCRTRAEALAADRAELRLVQCETCGHVFNSAFDDRLLAYDARYESALDFSPRFREFAEALVSDLVSRAELRGRTVVEIGCGRGEFLDALCTRAGARGLGFDPGVGNGASASGSVTLVRTRYPEARIPVDTALVVCRHVLEHLGDPMSLIATLRSRLGPESAASLYMEVPNALATLDELAVWDLVYEHVSYYNAYSLARLVARGGFSVDAVVAAYGNQFLCLHGRAAATASDAPASAEEARDAALRHGSSFADRFRDKVAGWRMELERRSAAGERLVVWGAGSKGVMFLGWLGERIDHAVDLNPRKHGRYVAGSGQEILAPEHLRDLAPDVILVMNAVYRDEIAATIEQLGIKAQLACV